MNNKIRKYTKACIYLAKNIENNKCYVGQTYYGLTRRKKMHLHQALKANKPSCLFHKALKYLGPEIFEWSVLEEIPEFIDTEDLQRQLNEKEIFWISQYESFGEKGYNMNKGGNSGRRYKYATLEEKKEAKRIAKRKYRKENYKEHRAKQNARNAKNREHRRELLAKYKDLYPERYILYKERRKEKRKANRVERRQRKKEIEAWLAINQPEILEARKQRKKERREARKVQYNARRRDLRKLRRANKNNIV